MAITLSPHTAELLTYAQYMENYLEGRYDIVEGVLITMPGPDWEHQKISFRIAKLFDRYQTATGSGEMLTAPFDVLIRRTPRLKTRQPDLFYISSAQLARGGGIPQRGPLPVAPELVVEIISDSETEERVREKIADYIEIGVREMWCVRPDTQTVEVVRLEATGAVVVQTYAQGDIVVSLTFPDLQAAVNDIFTA